MVINLRKCSILALVLLLVFAFGKAQAQTSLLDGKKWTKTDLSTNKPSGGFMTGSMQGAAILNGNMYQFRTNGASGVNYDVYDISAGTWTSGKALTCIPSSHAGSGCFGTKVFTTSDGYQYDCTMPFLYLTNGQTIQIVDVENDSLVATWTLASALQDDAIAAYDFAGGTLYSIGYVTGSRKAPYIVREKTGLNFNVVPTDQTITFTDDEKTSVGGPDADGIQRTLINGTLQDCQYVDGKVYICYGGGSSAHRTERCGVHVYDVSSKTIVDTKLSISEHEAEGFVYDANIGSFLMATMGNELWKLSAGTGYDTQYNFQPATLNGEYYEISNASQLLWFKQQVYGGRTSIKAKLTADIDMQGVTDPFSYYVYDYNIALAGKTTATYPATFAFRGEFDGQSHTIKNYTISSTPYYYDGLFPYAIGANIHDLTVRGSITLTQCDAMSNADGSWKAVSKQPVAYVGLIGYMDGGTVSNVNSYISIDETVAGVSGTINKLIGGTSTTVPTTTNCSTEDPSQKTHAQNGGKHMYENGFCICSDAVKTENGYYEEPVEVTVENYESLGLASTCVGYYAVQNAGNMFWIAKNFSSSNYNRNYVMTADIDMAGDDAIHQDWAGIGEYNNNTKTSHFCGTFDGNGHKFTNFYMKVSSSWKAIFNLTNAGAVIKNFTISGQMDISGGGQIGAVVGRVQGTTKLEDIHSSVNLTVASGKTISAIGGIVGQVSGETSLNRCRYSGTITGNSSYNALGGIIGNAENPITVNNCLFDGTITTTSTQARTGVDNGLKIGGICGRNNNKTTITNSMSRGTISVPEAADKGNVGIILGTQTNTNKLTITNTYYSSISGIDAVGNNSNTDQSSANPTAITNETPLSLRIALGQANWKFVEPIVEYPVPGTGGPILQVVTITFDTKGGSAVTPISGVEGTEITSAPANPTKEGHTFAGWVDADGNATTVPEMMPSSNLTIYASWTVNPYTITLYETEGGTVLGTITQDYGTTITKPANPTRDDWDFSGWSPGIPTTMPAGNMSCVAQWTREEYDNGFNTNTSCAASVKYQMPKGTGTVEDPYLIDNGGKLWWFATQVQSDKTLCAKLTKENINTECSTRGNMPQMGAWGAPYKGTFNGQGNTISDWKQTWAASRSGMFGYTENATIKDFTLEGTMTVSGANQQIAPVVGYAGSGTLVEDIHSKVNITANSTVWAIGGIVGRQNGTVNRCRYSGTITCATGVYNGIGGIVGETYGGTTNNCLFDGTIIAPSSDASLRVGGIVGYQSESTASTVKNCFVNGTITVANYSTATSGIVFGGLNAANVRINASNIYYTNNNVSASLDRAAGISSRAAMGHCENVTSKDCITDGTLRDLLGNGNWQQDAEVGYPIPHKGTATEGYDANGFSYSKDGTHASLGEPVDGYYEISNGGQLLDYAEKVNAGTIALTSKARLTKDVDLEWCDFPGIGYYTDGNNQKKFQGTFDGQGHTISGMFRLVQGSVQRKGLFNFVTNATIKDFTVEGEIQVHEGTNSTFFIGGVVGIGDSNVTLEDVTSSVDINVINGIATTRIIGGVAGRIKGTMNRCRYNGTIDLGTNTAQQVGGVLASANVTTMSNCLFDGTILAATSNTGADYVVIGGLLGIDNEYVTMKNCLSNGTITLSNASAATTKVGAVWGQIQKAASSSTVTYYTTTNVTSGGTALDQVGGTNASSNMTTTAVGETSWADVTLALNNNSTATGNWQIVSGQEYPIPSYFSHEHTYSKYGYCTVCQHAEDLEQDEEGYYAIKHLAGLSEFRNLVNSSPKGTIINAKVTEDIDVTGVPVRWGELIGTSTNPYCGTFDGQGHSFKGLDATSDHRYVGVFECVGIKDSDPSKAVAGVIKNFSVSGKLTATYFSKWNTNTPLCMGVIGEIYNGTVENVHSSVEFVCTSGTRSHIGGVVGGSLHMATDAGEIVIKNSSFTGKINGVNASDCIGGIVGYAQHKTYISNCLFAGSISQNYTRPNAEEDNGNNQGPVSTYVGGVLGYTNSTSNGVKNCVITGTMSSNLTDFQTEKMGSMKNNMNICVGYDGSINTSYENYHGNFISQTVKDNYHQLPSSLFSGTAKIRTDAQFATGEACAELNADESATDNPWGQILGYQVGANKDPNSPAQAFPFPGYTDPEQTTYRVVRTKNAEDNTKYDYTADFYFFDDFGDTTPYPENAASMKVKKIEYTRGAKYLKGYISMCLPFALEKDLMPADAKCYQYSGINGNNVNFSEIKTFPIAAGTPFFMYSKDAADWANKIEVEAGTSVALNAINPESDAVGVFGTFNTITPGAWTETNQLYKLHVDGDRFVRTKASSNVFPFRVYLRLPASASSNEYTPVFLDDDDLTSINEVESYFNAIPQGTRYNLMGQKVSESYKGIVIVNGKKYFVK